MPEELLSPREIRRYSRQIMVPEIGQAGQEKLKKARIAVVGAGGLGCPVLQYLAAAGIGKLAIIENDFVDEANLQRQVLYGSADIGKLKSIIAKNSIEHLNNFTEVELFNLRLVAANSLRILRDFDIVIDATDNYETRYVINDTCVMMGIPMVHGSIYRYEGQVAVFNYKGGPTYRCFNPWTGRYDLKDPDPGSVGLLGVLPGITGTWMANEAIKIITGTGDVLSGKILVFNILTNLFRVINIRNKPENHVIDTISSTQINNRKNI
ncbi:MAG: HesA/MoeB/ThiF family protein [Bacteroidales bacterium]|jgi:adenylyltransferase/sulfurtransferase|nr:HesA/MoeB/ThiF family protein [Bacteroidales bacterium]